MAIPKSFFLKAAAILTAAWAAIALLFSPPAAVVVPTTLVIAAIDVVVLMGGKKKKVTENGGTQYDPKVEAKAREELAKTPAADIVAADNADGHLSAERDADSDAVSGSYREKVLDKSGDAVSGIFRDSGRRPDPR